MNRYDVTISSCSRTSDHNKRRIGMNSEEKETTSDLLESSRSATPLSVPVVADTSEQALTRNDAKVITQTRLKRLKQLSQKSEQELSKTQKTEKRRIIRLEKNRRAASMSRRKKKMYVKSLEEKYTLMGRHLSILEMENAHLRALLNASNRNMNALQARHLSQPPMNSELVRNFTSSLNNSISETANNSTISSSRNNTIEPEIETSHYIAAEPSLKRRRLNDGSGVRATSSSSCDNTPDMLLLEPMPLNNVATNNNHNNTQNTYMPHNHMLPYASSINSYNIPSAAVRMPYAPSNANQNIMRNVMHQQQLTMNALNIDNKKRNESESVQMCEFERNMEFNGNNVNANGENNDVPPVIEDFPVLDCDLLQGNVDDFGSFNDIIYL